MHRIKQKGKKKPKKGRTLMDKLKEVPDPKKGSPAAGSQKQLPPISPEDAQFVKDHLSTDLGKLLLATLEPISRRDLHPNNLNISFDPVLSAIDIHVVFVDTNTPLWSNLQRVMWRNRMTWRFDGSGPQLMLILRWFLPYQFEAHTAVDPGTEKKLEGPVAKLVEDYPEPPVPNPEEVEEQPTAEEEVGQTKQSTIEDAMQPPEGDGPKEVVPHG